MLGFYLPMRFGAGEPFHAGAGWQMMDLGLKGMVKVLADSCPARPRARASADGGSGTARMCARRRGPRIGAGTCSGRPEDDDDDA
jgi:hypothetical protein